MLVPGGSRRQQLTAELFAERSPRELRLVKRRSRPAQVPESGPKAPD
jgi:hypothetical protein